MSERGNTIERAEHGAAAPRCQCLKIREEQAADVTDHHGKRRHTTQQIEMRGCPIGETSGVLQDVASRARFTLERYTLSAA
jgi:hypothetical protein